jgi:tetratricopeptide (TPR) repeat protein
VALLHDLAQASSQAVIATHSPIVAAVPDASILELGHWGIGQAILIGKPLLADKERVLGADHPDTLGTRNNLAIAYSDAGRTDEAIRLYEQTLADQERVLGADHPETLATRNNLAIAYRAAGRTDEEIDAQPSDP